MGISKEHPHARKSLHVRGIELLTICITGKCLISTGIPHAHIISHHYNHIWCRTGTNGQAKAPE